MNMFSTPIISPGDINCYILIYITDIDECESSPCGHGNCSEGIDTFSCFCHTGYTGSLCETGNLFVCTQMSFIFHRCGFFAIWLHIKALSQRPTSPDRDLHIQTETYIPLTETYIPPTETYTHYWHLMEAEAGVTHHTGMHSCYFDFWISEMVECDSIPCLNNGSCSDVPLGYECACMAGYNSTNCEKGTPIDFFWLLHHQEIFLASSDYNILSYSMINFQPRLKLIYSQGILFWNISDINECGSNPCENGATCSQGIDVYWCDCVNGFNGTQCEHSTQDILTNFTFFLHNS